MRNKNHLLVIDKHRYTRFGKIQMGKYILWYIYTVMYSIRLFSFNFIYILH